MARKIDKVFVDSSFFVALYNDLDNQHQKAKKISQKLLEEDPESFISNFIFSEIVTIISQKVSRKAAVEAGLDLPLGNGLIYIDPYLHQKTWEIFKKIDRKNVSYVDCSILAVMQHLGITTLLTFDTTDFKSLQKALKFKLFPL